MAGLNSMIFHPKRLNALFKGIENKKGLNSCPILFDICVI
jgi:hypothetical protein